MFRADTGSGSIELPSLALIPVCVVQAVHDAPEDQRMWVLFEELADDATLDVLDSMTTSALRALVAEWEEDSDIAIGELLQIHSIIKDKDHRGALESDLIGGGLRLRHCPTDQFNWHDLLIFIRFRPVTSDLYGSMFPERAGWTKQALLQADAADTLNILAWQPTKDGRSGRNVPKRIPRPGVTPEARDGSKPKAAPLSVIKKKFADRYGAVAQPVRDKAARLKDIFEER